jgi:hypothetical protein
MDLFKPDALWLNAIEKTTVFKISHQFAPLMLSSRRASIQAPIGSPFPRPG